MTVREHADLATLPPNGYVDGVYSILNPQIGTTRAGKVYLKCLLRDATGEVPGRQWTFDESFFDEMSSTGYVWVAGHTQLYNGQIQIILEQIKPAQVSREEIRSLLPTSKFDLDEMFGRMRSILGTLEHPAMRALADTFLSDEDLMVNFRMVPAAMSLHHAWIGGLLEHTLQLLRLADGMLPLYPHLNRDLVLMGLFLHDMGKTAELTWQRGFDYTADGNLIGHVVRGAIWLQVKAAMAARQSGERLPGAALRVLQHIVLSHHGALEYGAAKVPSTPEAIFVAHLDNLDAKTTMALTAARRDEDLPADESSGFTDKIWALNTRLYRPDPLKQPSASPAAAPEKPSPPAVESRPSIETDAVHPDTVTQKP